MALQRSRDRRFQSQQPPSILAPPPPPPQQQHQILVAPPQQLSPGAFHYYHHHHHPQPHQQPSPHQQQQHQQHQQHQQQQQQQRHQVQFYQRPDPILQAQTPAPIPVLDLYRQRPQQQQPPPFLSTPHRIQSSAWDDRSFRGTGIPQSSDGFNNLHHLSRLDNSGNVALENPHARYPDPSRLIPGYVRPFDKPDGVGVGVTNLVHRAPSHDRNTYWPPFTGTGMYTSNTTTTSTPTPSEVNLVPRGYHHRTPSPSPQRLREHFLESGRHFNSPPLRSQVGRKRSRSRSRSRSPVRFNQRGSRALEYSRPWRHHVETRKEDEDDEREDGQLTPSGSPEIHQEPRRKVSYKNRRVTRDRSGFRGSPQKRTRSDDRGETSSKKLPRQGSDQKEKDPARAAQNGRNREKPTRKDGGSSNKSLGVKFVPVETAGEASAAAAAGDDDVSSSRQDRVKQGAEADDSSANAGLQVQEVVNLEFDPAPEGGSKEVYVEKSANSQAQAQCVILVPGEEQAPQKSGDKSSEAPAEGLVSQVSQQQAMKSSLEAQATKDLDQTSKFGAPDAQKQAKQAVLTIRKNPSMPVAFKPGSTGLATSKTWVRSGGIPGGVSKQPNVFIGVSSVPAQAPNSNNINNNNNNNIPAYVRKGNSLVRAPGSATTTTTTTSTTTPPVSKQSSTPAVRAPVMMSGLKITITSKASEVPATPVAAELDRVASKENPGDVQTTVLVEMENGDNNTNNKNNNIINSSSGISAKLSPPRVESSETYYRRKMNQLLRNPASGSSGKQLRRTRLGRVLRLKKRSLVWTLSGSKGPLLLPWKKRLSGRTRTRRFSSLPNGSNGSLLSLISKKLQAFRTSQPLYTRSANGFALHRSGLRSVAGTNLKWTKSLEMRSREANEEATKAVAAVEKRCRKDKAGGKIRERIVMVGLVRYKMDPSTRTLQRLQDSPENSTLQSSSNRKISALTPRRASIGGALYVRMGNGNQLVRDPKASSRALASEKVRWSLHKVRSRISKKQQYCQFFTRFGRCNKGDSRCPYIHDSEKVVVCTKFLKGNCSNPSCLLTHKVLPERMPDCSFFLQGLCINEECPYRHVNVNPTAPVCEGFLKGYCSSGDQCNKKHTYVCPRYSASGDCPDRKACKLHHPKKKLSRNPPSGSGSRARYFTGELPSHPLSIGSLQDRPGFEVLADFISLQGLAPGDELSAESEPDESSARRSNPRPGLLCFSEMPEEEVDRLIKPAFVWQSRSNQEPIPA